MTGLLDSAGNYVAWYEYDAFGKVMTEGGSLKDANPIRFSTQYTDDETGLVYYGFRFYDPSKGRFLTRDPIGEAGGLNLYRFVGNDPVGRVDVWGLSGDGFEHEWQYADFIKGGQYANEGYFDGIISHQVSAGPQTYYIEYEGTVCQVAENALEAFNGVIRAAQSPSYNSSTGNTGKPEFVQSFVGSAGGDLMALPLVQIGIMATDSTVRLLNQPSLSSYLDDWSRSQRDVGVGAPGFAEGLIPIWGSARSAVNDFQNGRWGWGIFNTAMAVSDVFLVKSLVTGLAKGAVLGGSKAMTGAARSSSQRVSVLGSYQPHRGRTYVQFAEEIGARRFALPDDKFLKLVQRAEKVHGNPLHYNQLYLDSIVKRGDLVRLNISLPEMNAILQSSSNAFRTLRWEIDDLLGRGISWGDDLMSLVSPAR